MVARVRNLIAGTRHKWAMLRGWRWKADRPYRLIVFALLPLVLVAILERLLMAEDMSWFRDWVKESPTYGPLFFPAGDGIEWKDRLQGVLLLLGLPVAFCLWYWRDRNVRDQIENARKDINLKEFQEVQLRAAGALDTTLPEEARQQWQIAALHQLRGFLRGEYGESFRRPAFELLLAGHAAAMKRIGIEKIIDRLPEATGLNSSGWLETQIAEFLKLMSPVDRERKTIIEHEKAVIFNSGFPLAERNFDLLDLVELNLEGVEIWNSSFIGSDLTDTNLTDVDASQGIFFGTKFIASNLTRACLAESNMEYAELVVANLDNTTLDGANTRRANFDEANLAGARFWGVDLQGTKLGRSNWRLASYGQHWFEWTKFDDQTILENPKKYVLWDEFPEKQRQQLRSELRALGARHMSDPAHLTDD
jgi:uncharacterized protein YjbI with pentapeptide repeats